ncbi:MAG: N-acetylmuramoyl-L-alanine amidase, partial [Ignavibacteriales bacterium]|nr:N-acetylmuramoyl-L-alanine amidase [Ignavibacteriales bacterium]
MIRLFFAIVFLTSSLFAQVPGTSSPDSSSHKDSLFLRIVIPERDTIRGTSSRYRVAASTLPTAKAFVNGKEVKVYPSGAFVSLLNVAIGSNRLHLMVQSPAGDSLWKDFVVIRPEPPQSLPHDPAVIDETSIEPAQDLWLGKDDILEVKFKGSPGYEAFFSIDGVESNIPMRELKGKEAGGMEGIYIGRYKVKDSDESREKPIRVRLKKSFWSSERAYSKGKISIFPNELPRVAEITGRKPFLNAGLGEDRLGGAKLGYIPSSVRVRVTGKVGRQYRIQLSEAMMGWLPEDFAQLLPLETPLPRSLVGSTSATGTKTEDIVTVSLSQRLPYIAEQLTTPTALAVDIFGATSNTNWMTHHLSASGIKNVSWDQIGAEHYRLTITLNYAQHWGYEIGYDNGSSLRIRFHRPPEIANPDSVLAGLIIAVDAGHGGENQGALGATGVREMNVTFATASHLKSALEAKGARVVMTRTESSAGPGMMDRWDAAQAGNAQLLVSIHCNSTGSTADPEVVK